VLARSQIGASVHALRFPRPFLSSFLPVSIARWTNRAIASVSVLFRSCLRFARSSLYSLFLPLVGTIVSSCRRESRRNKFLIKRTRDSGEARARAGAFRGKFRQISCGVLTQQVHARINSVWSCSIRGDPSRWELFIRARSPGVRDPVIRVPVLS